MKLKKKTNLLKDLVDSDFFLEKSTNTKSSFLIAKKNVFCVSNLLELNKEIKQFVSLLLYLKSNKSFSLYIIVENSNLVEFWKNLLKDFCSTCFVFISTNLPTSKNLGCNLVLFIGNYTSFLYKHSLKSLQNNSFFLAIKINSIFQQNFEGSYKIKNSVDTYKNIIFLSSIIRKCLNSK